MRNAELCHVWTINYTGDNKGKGSNMHFVRNIMYSYDTPVARIDNGVLFITNHWYSTSTQQHLSHIRNACSHFDIVEVKDSNDILYSMHSLIDIINDVFKEADHLLELSKDPNILYKSHILVFNNKNMREDICRTKRNIDIIKEHFSGLYLPIDNWSDEKKKLFEALYHANESYIINRASNKKTTDTINRFVKMLKKSTQTEDLHKLGVKNIVKQLQCLGIANNRNRYARICDRIYDAPFNSEWGWIEDDILYTTKYVKFSKDYFKRLLLLAEQFLKLDKDSDDFNTFVGKHTGPYTINVCTYDKVCIGCHTFCRKSIEEMKESLEMYIARSTLDYKINGDK